MGMAIVFDFDGLILDTETPLYESWRHTFEHYGASPITAEEWSRSLGRADDDTDMLDPAARLRELVGDGFDEHDAQRRRRAFRDAALAATSVSPGVVDLLDAAEQADIPVAIASSSPPDWIDRHLSERGLVHRFHTISCAGHGVPGKPAPATYLEACRAMGADPRRSIALEDSPNGIAAARAAGLYSVAVPTVLFAGLDFSAADRVVDTLEGLTIDELISSALSEKRKTPALE